jgi:hypothetical protein
VTSQQAQEVIDTIIGQIFGFKNPYTLDQFQQKFAFDVRLPSQVTDATTGQITWAQSVNPNKFIKMDNAWKMFEANNGLLPTEKLTGIEDILSAWSKVNLTATERQLDSVNVSQSDNIYGCDGVYRSLDCHDSKNVVFCDAANESEYVAASQRSHTLSYVLRADDSNTSSKSFGVSWSQKVTNSFFIHDCGDIQDSMFCSHITNKRFCIANMQFEEAEYMRLRDIVVRWILTQ